MCVQGKLGERESCTEAEKNISRGKMVIRRVCKIIYSQKATEIDERVTTQSLKGSHLKMS